MENVIYNELRMRSYSVDVGVVHKDIVPPHYDEYGILTVNIYDFLLAPECLEK